ncbi:ROK family protein [Ktedonospora formicarum]|uniref:Glucokinase n=1 Tax=Ktedonospora formicarum TaxID=2778364 RepID=A0A8J3IGC3_9CHLR|nr:ROK family protein [Ktedonospora formicarum]GHO50649.1 glucokinase [Ktedonospora formicarum]
MNHTGVHDFVLAVDFGGTKIAIATADLAGHVLEQSRLETRALDGAEQILTRTLAEARVLIARTEAQSKGQCVSIGIASPGIVRDDGIALSPNIPGWEHVRLRFTMRTALGVATIVAANDVKAAALAEVRWGALQNANPAVFLSLGTGIASALIVDGRVLTGAHGASGEIGYNLRGVSDIYGAAHGRAPLEEVVGGRFIGERGSKLLGEQLSAAELFSHADVRVHSFVEETLTELATHVANLAILIDPARIAIGGGLMNSSSLILDAISSRLAYAVPFPPELVPAHFLSDSSLYGAIALALTEWVDGKWK